MHLTFARAAVAASLALSIGVLVSSCSSAKSSTPTTSGAAATGQPASKNAIPNTTPLLGDMKPVVSVKELMEYMIDPASDYVFDSVKTLVQPNGKVIEIVPKTDEDWKKLQVGAVTMLEGIYLLKVQRPFAPAGDVNNSVGPDATELSPEQIVAKVNGDPVEWNARIEALRNVGLEVLEIVKKRNTKELWDASENLDEACESCHRSYWYPKEDSGFYRELDQKLHDLPAPKTFSSPRKR
jgi:hypothetical protein